MPPIPVKFAVLASLACCIGLAAVLTFCLYLSMFRGGMVLLCFNACYEAQLEGVLFPLAVVVGLWSLGRVYKMLGGKQG